MVERRRFQIDTLISAITNGADTSNFASPLAQAEFPALCAYLFSEASPEDAKLLSAEGKQAGFAMFGLRHEYEDLYDQVVEGLNKAKDQPPEKRFAIIRESVKASLGLTKDFVILPAPLVKNTTEMLSFLEPRITAYVEESRKRTLADPGHLEVPMREYLYEPVSDMLKHDKQDHSTQSANGAQAAEAGIPETAPRKLLFMDEILAALDIIAHEKRLPIKRADYTDMSLDTPEKKRSFMVVELASPIAGTFMRELQSAGLGKYVHDVPSKDSDRRIVAIDVQKIDSSVMALETLQKRAKQLAAPVRRQA